MRDIAHVNDPELLRNLVVYYKELTEKLLCELKVLREENARLRGEERISAIQQELFALQSRINALTAKLFGSSSERRTDDPDDPDVESSNPSEPDDSNPNEDDKKSSRKRTGHGPTSQPELPIIDVPHSFELFARFCPLCDRPLRTMNGQEQASFEVDIIPAQIILKRHLQEKVACDNGCVIETAPSPLKLIPGGRYSINFALDIAVGRYLEHTPLYRLRNRYAHMGLNVSIQSLFDQLYAVAQHLRPTWTAIKHFLDSREQLFGDETPWKLFTRAETQQWYLWSLSSYDAVWYTFADSRSALISRSLLLHFEGQLQCDGLASYSALPENGGAHSSREFAHFIHPEGGLVGTSKGLLSPMNPLPITIGLCWSHARRLFLPFEKTFAKPTRRILQLIRQLYAIEDEAHKLARQKAPPDASQDELHYGLLEARAQLRPVHSAPIVDQIRQFLDLEHALPRSEFEKAKAYLKNSWPDFVRFLNEPSLDLDNNKSERALRGPVVSRKNSYGSHSVRGLLVTAVFYSLFESAKLSGVEPRAYVKAALEQAILKPGSYLLPWEFARNLKAIQPPQSAQTAA